MIVDAHVHVGTWDHADFLGRGCTLEGALDVLRVAGVDGAVLLPSDRCESEALLRDARAAVRGGFEGPLWVVPWVRPVRPGHPGNEDLAWVRQNRSRIAGLKIHPSLSRERVTDAGFAPALELARELGLAVLVHCGRWQEIASYRFAVEAAERHREVRFVLAHAGGDTPPLATAAADLVAERGLDNVWFDLSGLREYWVAERNIRRLGADRYLMASDYSLAHPLMYVGAVRGMDLSEEERRLVLGDNARRVFGDPLSP